MKALAELVPSFSVHSLGVSPFAGFWPFNPSVLRTSDDRWICSVRCANYHLPGSAAAPARSYGPIRNRNLILELEPGTWRVTRSCEVHDRSGIANVWNAALGFEDLRLVRTDEQGLCATATAMRIETGMLEMVVLSLDERDYRITHAHPLRGAWSNQHQKNWSPFAGARSLRALYSVLGGGVHNLEGRITPTNKPPSIDPVHAPRGPSATHFHNGSMEVKIRYGGMMPPAVPETARLALRGGTQLIHVGDGRWLGIAHGCKIGASKYYWHTAYQVDGNGKLLALSDPFKLSPEHGIEFAAGLAVDPVTKNLVVSFGLEDDSAWLGITKLDSILGITKAVA